MDVFYIVEFLCYQVRVKDGFLLCNNCIILQFKELLCIYIYILNMFIFFKCNEIEVVVLKIEMKIMLFRGEWIVSQLCGVQSVWFFYVRG